PAGADGAAPLLRRFDPGGVCVPRARAPGGEPAGARGGPWPARRTGQREPVDRDPVTATPPRALGPKVTATAPVRLDFAGGWTDVPPFSDREGGGVVNAALDLRVEAGFEPGREGLLLRAEDLRQAAPAPGGGGRGRDGKR